MSPSSELAARLEGKAQHNEQLMEDALGYAVVLKEAGYGDDARQTEQRASRYRQHAATARAEKAEAERDALAARVAELEGALKPFAGYLNGCFDVPGCRTADDVGLWQTANHISDLPFTYGDVRRANVALSRTPAPDPRDTALRLAETELLRLWKLVPAGRAGVGGVRTIELEDDEVARLRQIVDAIRAAKGGAE